MKIVLAVVVVLAAGLAPPAYGQPGDRTALVYGARRAGDSQWQFGSLSVQAADATPLTIEVGVFCYRAQGIGLATAVFKAYIDTPLTNSVSIVEDTSNGVPSTGVDGRVGVFNDGPAFFQSVYTNRNAIVPGSGYRISSPSDLNDGNGAGGVSVHQYPPATDNGFPNPNYDPRDGVLTYRFNVTANPVAFPSQQTIHIFSPFSRVSTYNVHNSIEDPTTTSLRSTLVIDAIDLNLNWVPAPGSLPALVLGGALTPRRRRP